MKQELTVQPMMVGDIMSMAKTFAESGLFNDTKDMAKAFVKIQAGQEIGIAPFQAMSGIHIIQGKPTIGAGIMASKIKGSGKYDYKVIQQDETACVLEFYQGKEKLGKSSFTIEDAKRAGTQNVAKYARNMLFARAISNGLKWYCPDVFSGPVYTPEDFNGVEQETGNYEDISHEELAQEVKLKPAMPSKMFGQLVSKIEAGNTDVLGKAKENYTLSQEQIDTIEAIDNVKEIETEEVSE